MTAQHLPSAEPPPRARGRHCDKGDREREANRAEDETVEPAPFFQRQVAADSRTEDASEPNAHLGAR
eukprot:scaffold33114_cov74-Phaeocystis_antarctica.AAC.1